jgi:hypothetical protein
MIRRGESDLSKGKRASAVFEVSDDAESRPVPEAAAEISRFFETWFSRDRDGLFGVPLCQAGIR